MLKQLTNAQVWVHDQDEALDFYTEKLGLELREDVTVPELGNFRWLSVGVPGQPDVAITLMAIPGPPVFDAETQEAIKTLVAKGVASGLFFATDDVHGTYEELKGRGVEFSAGADRAAVRRRRRLPRPVGQPDARGAAELAGALVDDGYVLKPIGFVRSPLRARTDAPRQGSEGAPDAWILLEPSMADALQGIAAGDRLVVVTWLHEAQRDVLQVHPRDDASRPLTGVFATRSSDRPNPLGLHRVTVYGIDGLELAVGPLEAIDGTPVVDLKPHLREDGA